MCGAYRRVDSVVCAALQFEHLGLGLAVVVFVLDTLAQLLRLRSHRLFVDLLDADALHSALVSVRHIVVFVFIAADRDACCVDSASRSISMTVHLWLNC